FLTMPPGTAKGYFGSRTQAALAAYQRSIGYPAYGFFGQMTRGYFKDHNNNGNQGNLSLAVTSGPTSLAIGQLGTWSVMATSPINRISNFTYSVTWGDEAYTYPVTYNAAVIAPTIQNSTFTHSYVNAGTYTITFTVRDDRGFTATKTAVVVVGNSTVSVLKVTSPNGGENWFKGTTQNITWNAPQYFRATTVTIDLVGNLVCPTGYVCMPNAPHRIVKDISVDNHSYLWNVGIDQYGLSIPDGQYTIQICESGTSVCDSSDMPFTISSQNTYNQAPVISGLDAPTTLGVGQLGTWTVRASNPQNNALSYSVTWGDEQYYAQTSGLSSAYNSFVQSASFTHSYSSTGTYTVRVTVKNSSGLTTQTSATVNVTGSSVNNQITVISPNGGENWVIGSSQRIQWTNLNSYYGNKVDLFLITNVNCPVSVGGFAVPCVPPISYLLDRNIETNTIYNWIVGTDTVNNPIPAGSYVMKICVAGTSNCDVSNGAFNLTSNLLKICPSQKIVNAMPSYGVSAIPASYFILNGQRRELSEFDLNWVASYCSVPTQTVY
ncbi:MAG: PKD domain-containing protein, partial [bacterium]